MSQSFNSFSAILPREMRDSVTRNHRIGYLDIGVPLHLVKAEIVDRLIVPHDDKWRAVKRWHELLIADGRGIVEIDGKPASYVGDILRVEHQPQENSRIYYDYDRLLPPAVRHQGLPKDVVFEGNGYKLHLVHATLSELGGNVWSQNLLVADNLNVSRRHPRLVGINGRIIGVDNHPVVPGGNVLDDAGHTIGNLYGYKVVGCEPPRPGDQWSSRRSPPELMKFVA